MILTLQMTDMLGPLPATLLAHSPLAQQLGLHGADGSTAAAPGPTTASLAATTPAATTPGGAVVGPPAAISPSLHALRALDPALGDLVGMLLCYDPAQRSTAAQVRRGDVDDSVQGAGDLQPRRGLEASGRQCTARELRCL